jgi:hypothetical protein
MSLIREQDTNPYKLMVFTQYWKEVISDQSNNTV